MKTRTIKIPMIYRDFFDSLTYKLFGSSKVIMASTSDRSSFELTIVSTTKSSAKVEKVKRNQ